MQMRNTETYIGLGSNLDNPKAQVVLALRELGQIRETLLVKHSSLYISKPLGPSDQPDYINAVAKLETRLNPESLLDALHNIEQLHLRKRGLDKWGPRTLDLDIILYGEMNINNERLQIPHSGLKKREFVLIPLQEIQPDLIIPGSGELSKLINQLPDYQLLKLEIQDVEP